MEVEIGESHYAYRSTISRTILSCERTSPVCRLTHDCVVAACRAQADLVTTEQEWGRLEEEYDSVLLQKLEIMERSQQQVATAEKASLAEIALVRQTLLRSDSMTDPLSLRANRGTRCRP